MKIKKSIENEIMAQKKVLSRIEFNKSLVKISMLTCKRSKGRTQFYLRIKPSNKKKYVSESEFWKLEMLYREKLKAEISKTLSDNIDALEDSLTRLSDFDAESVAAMLPLAYRRLREKLDDIGAKKIVAEIPQLQNDEEELFIFKGNDDTKKVPQSENPKDRAGLKFKTSFGLMVRSKNELLIAEALYTAGVKFLYEARLELVEGIGDAATNRETYNMEALFPDFTIILPDGERIYWEHLGMWENEDYREDNVRRLTLYFTNGIYPPKNLILTVDGNKMPFDNSAVWRIIEGQILSRY